MVKYSTEIFYENCHVILATRRSNFDDTLLRTPPWPQTILQSCQWHDPLELSWTTSIGCMVNNSIVYSEFVFSSSNIKIELVTMHFKTWLHDWFLELGLLSKKIGSYVILFLFWKVSVQISTACYNKISNTRLWRVFWKKCTYKSRVE